MDLNPLPHLLTVEEIAETLGLSAQAIYRLTKAGKLPAVKIHSRALRFDPDAVREALEQLTVHDASAQPTGPHRGRSGAKRGPKPRIIDLGRCGR